MIGAESSGSIFDQWADCIVKALNAESSLAGLLLKHKGELGDAREALIDGVLSRVLPSGYEIGSGEIIDAYGGRSKQIDIVISRRDAPSLLLPSGSRLYLVESVLATIEVKSGLDKRELTKALENCASVADLKFNVTSESYDAMASKTGVAKTEKGFIFDDRLEAERFLLRGSPVSYIFGFSGHRTIDGFATVIRDWGVRRMNDSSLNFGMKYVPSVIATDAFVALRNAPPYHMSPDGAGEERVLSLIGTDVTPLRMLIAHLLHTLNSKMPPDEYGLVPNPSKYLEQGSPFDFQLGLFGVPEGRSLVPLVA